MIVPKLPNLPVQNKAHANVYNVTLSLTNKVTNYDNERFRTKGPKSNTQISNVMP